MYCPQSRFRDAAETRCEELVGITHIVYNVCHQLQSADCRHAWSNFEVRAIIYLSLV